jgi:Flp pilus assembly protein TadG
MIIKEHFNILRQTKGQSVVELALILPVLLLLSFGVFEYSRSILTKNIITNMSREGANLAARTQTDQQTIMTAIATTADPLDMSANGMIFITEVMGKDDGSGTVYPIIQNQYRYMNGGYSANSMVYGCTNWTDGKCTVYGEPIADLDDDIETAINDGETVFAVEVFYDYAPIISYVLNNHLEIYSCNVF